MGAATDRKITELELAFAQHFVEVIMSLRPIGSGRGFDPVAITMWLASKAAFATRSIRSGEAARP